MREEDLETLSLHCSNRRAVHARHVCVLWMYLYTTLGLSNTSSSCSKVRQLATATGTEHTTLVHCIDSMTKTIHYILFCVEFQFL